MGATTRTIAAAAILGLAALPARAADCAPDAETAQATGATCIGPVTFTCTGGRTERLEATFFDDPMRVEIALDGQTLTAERAMAASGARYTGADGLEFWNRGDEAMVTLPGGESLSCTSR